MAMDQIRVLLQRSQPPMNGQVGELPAWRWYPGHLCLNVHMSPLPMECRNNLTPGIGITLECSLRASAARTAALAW